MAVPEYIHLNQFLDYLKFEKRFSEHTVISYQTDLNQFIDYLQVTYDGVELSKVTPSFVRSWLAEMRNNGQSAKTLNRKISTLRSFYKYLMKQEVITVSPMATIVAPKVSKRLPSFVAEKDMETLQHAVEFPDTFKGRTDKLLIELLYSTGMRLSELVKLKETNVDLHSGQVKVLGKGNKERIIPIPKVLVELVKAYQAEKKTVVEPGLTDLLLVTEKGKPLYPKYVYTVVTNNLGYVTTLAKRSPHILRHTFATHLMNNGADLNAVKELLGHASLAATQVYTHNTIDKLKDIHKLAHPKA